MNHNNNREGIRPSQATLNAYNLDGYSAAAAAPAQQRPYGSSSAAAAMSVADGVLSTDGGYDADIPPSPQASSSSYGLRTSESAERKRSASPPFPRRDRSRSPLIAPSHSRSRSTLRREAERKVQRKPKPKSKPSVAGQARRGRPPMRPSVEDHKASASRQRRTPSPSARASGAAAAGGGRDVDIDGLDGDVFDLGIGQMVGGGRMPDAHRRGGEEGKARRPGEAVAGGDGGMGMGVSNVRRGPLSPIWGILAPDSDLRRQACIRCLISPLAGSDLSRDTIQMDSIIPNNYHQEPLEVLVSRVWTWYEERLKKYVTMKQCPGVPCDHPEWTKDMIRLHYLDHSVMPGTARATAMRAYQTMMQRLLVEMIEEDTVTGRKRSDTKLMTKYMELEQRYSALCKAATTGTGGGGGGGGGGMR
jgi:hypothetical protein